MPPREPAIPGFRRRFLDPTARVTAIGTGSPGGKGRGLIQLRDVLAAEGQAGAPLDVPAMAIIGADVFDRFMDDNKLWPVATGGASDAKIAMAFQAADLPIEIVGDLRALVEQAKTPLAVRSSSLLEDALEHPFAGVYATKMLPNDQLDADSRFRRLTEAIRLVYASTFFKAARSYLHAIDRDVRDEKMAVVVQEVVGTRHGVRFYPDVSGVARSYAFYRTGGARPEDGIVSLALGLGKTIVDGGITWDYSPARPRAGAPFATASDVLDGTQREFWAVSLGGTPRYDPISEIEYLVQGTLADAEADGVLKHVASSYDASADRLYPGIRGEGPRAVTFAPVLVEDELPLNDAVRRVLAASEAALGGPVEIEFACTLVPARFGFVQVRPMAVSRQPVDVAFTPADPSFLVASDAVLGNGENADVCDIVFVRRDRFDPAASRAIAADIDDLNAALVSQRRPYLLIGFGRWGSSDPWLGIPVNWSSISGARAIVETMLPSRRVEPSQGSHFFHNIASFGVLYFTVRPDIDPPIRWEWIEGQPAIAGTPYVTHVRTAQPLRIAVDGRSGRGVVRFTDETRQ